MPIHRSPDLSTRPSLSLMVGSAMASSQLPAHGAGRPVEKSDGVLDGDQQSSRARRQGDAPGPTRERVHGEGVGLPVPSVHPPAVDVDPEQNAPAAGPRSGTRRARSEDRRRAASRAREESVRSSRCGLTFEYPSFADAGMGYCRRDGCSRRAPRGVGRRVAPRLWWLVVDAGGDVPTGSVECRRGFRAPTCASLSAPRRRRDRYPAGDSRARARRPAAVRTAQARGGGRSATGSSRRGAVGRRAAERCRHRRDWRCRDCPVVIVHRHEVPSPRNHIDG